MVQSDEQQNTTEYISRRDFLELMPNPNEKEIQKALTDLSHQMQLKHGIKGTSFHIEWLKQLAKNAPNPNEQQLELLENLLAQEQPLLVTQRHPGNPKSARTTTRNQYFFPQNPTIGYRITHLNNILDKQLHFPNTTVLSVMLIGDNQEFKSGYFPKPKPRDNHPFRLSLSDINNLQTKSTGIISTQGRHPTSLITEPERIENFRRIYGL